jgi:hypothetical protein
MSHFTTIKTQIKDIAALEAACRELNLPLLHNAEARGYAGQTRRGDFIIKLNGPYDVAVNRQPDAGISWQAHPRLRAVFQVEWINWSDSFDELDIQLSNGSNADINGFLGSDQIHDVVPLDWKESNSRISVEAHWVGLTTGIRF